MAVLLRAGKGEVLSQALYRKYRPTSFKEIIGQDHITDTLSLAVKNGKLSHAYLFTGPRGVGKTSVARILAYLANGLKYGDPSASLDIIEIDGASNRRIEEVRDLREKIHILPSGGKYKVYIIDEVHMLTKEAFNALLKTLEEPPAHCIFILATTEAHKLPDTIVSRTQRFSFKPISTKDLVKSLLNTAKSEKIKTEPEALELLARHGQGSFRDSISLLDQLQVKDQPITADFVRQVIGIPPVELITKLCESIEKGEVAAVLDTLDQLEELNINPSLIARSISEELRSKLRASSAGNPQTSLLKDLLEVPGSPAPQDRLEVALLEAVNLNKPESTDTEPKKNTNRPAEPPKSQIEPKPQPKPKPKQHPPRQSPKTSAFKFEDWPKLLNQIEVKKQILYKALKFAVPKIEGDRLHLFFEFPLYKKKVDTAEHRKLISKILNERFGDSLTVVCNVDKDHFAAIRPDLIAITQQEANHSKQTISSIFGGGEVLESSVSI